MKNMKNEFTTYKQALALKELGFDEECFAWYVSKEYGLEIGKVIQTDLIKDAVVAPTFHQAFRFFREKYKLAVDIRSEHLGYYTSIVNRDAMMRIVMKPVNIFETYEEAEHACLNKLIEMIKS